MELVGFIIGDEAVKHAVRENAEEDGRERGNQVSAPPGQRQSGGQDGKDIEDVEMAADPAGDIDEQRDDQDIDDDLGIGLLVHVEIAQVENQEDKARRVGTQDDDIKRAQREKDGRGQLDDDRGQKQGRDDDEPEDDEAHRVRSDRFH